MIHMSGFGRKVAGVMELHMASQADCSCHRWLTSIWMFSLNLPVVLLQPSEAIQSTPLKKNNQLKHPYKSVVEHSISLGHSIEPHNTSILSTRPRHMDRIIREVTEIDLRSNNIVPCWRYLLGLQNTPLCLWHSFIADSTSWHYNLSFTLSTDPLMSCLGAVPWSLLVSKADC
jgi:hypothetical protein